MNLNLAPSSFLYLLFCLPIKPHLPLAKTVQRAGEALPARGVACLDKTAAKDTAQKDLAG